MMLRMVLVRPIVMTLALLGVVASQATAEMARMPHDGEIALPGNYKSWPKFLSEVQRPDVKQIRELYVNPIGDRVVEGQPFPNRTIFVMELYRAKADGDNLMKGVDGKLVKDDLTKVFVMEKGEGWGQDVPDNLKNGNWVFSAYGPDGKPLAEDFTKCRACHAPLMEKDFTHRYDEFFQMRAKKH